MRYSLYLLGLLLACMSLWQCKSFKGASVSATPNPLEMHADSLKFTVRADIPPKSGFKKKGTYTGKIVLKQGGNNYDMSSVTITREKYPDIRKAGASLTHKEHVLYQDGMDNGKLVIENTYQVKKKTKKLPELEIAQCCITTPRLVCDKELSECKTPADANMLTSTFQYQTRPPVELKAVFQFPKDVFKIQPNEYEKAEIKAMGDFLTTKKNVEKIILSGYASPEGPLKRNTMLAINRLQGVQKWLQETLKANGYTQYLDEKLFSLTTTPEDWEGFKANLSQMNYDEKKRDEIIRIASQTINEDLKEKKILALVGGVEKVESILAPLRRVTIILNAPSPDHTDQEINTTLNEFLLGRKNADQLKTFFQTPDEMLHGISKFPKQEDKRKILAEMVKIFPDDYRGHNDLGVYTLLAGDADGGLNNLRSANAKKGRDYMVLNNMGVGLKAMKNYIEAAKIFEESMSIQKSPQAAFALGIIHIQRARYDKGAEMFAFVKDAQMVNTGSQACAFHNLGLCNLLLSEAAESKNALEGSIQKDESYALSYYVLAILGARNGDATLVTDNLKKAVKYNSKLSEKASKDLEFRKFHATPEFKAAIQI